MPYSGPEFKNALAQIIESIKPTRALDIGVGAGTIGEIVKRHHHPCEVFGIEVEASYAQKFKKYWEAAYVSVEIGNAVELSIGMAEKRWDVVIFGDVLEHMWKHDALALLGFWQRRSKWVVAIWPNGYEQDAVDSKTSEIHRTEIYLSDLVSANLNVVRFHKYQRTVELAPVRQFKSIAVIKGDMLCNQQQGIVY